MATYVFEADDGDRIEVELPMARAPAFGARKHRDGKVYRRVIETAPVFVPPNIRSKSHQLPTWYGFRNNKQADEMARAQGRRTTERDRNLVGKINAERAGVLGEFSPTGNPRADTKTGINKHLRRGQNLGDKLVWD